MKIYVVAATIPEIEPLIENPLAPSHKLIVTGIGSAATCYHLTKVIREDKPDIIIQAGVAGGYDHRLPLAEVWIVRQDRFADLGVEEDQKWRDVFDLGLANPDDLPFKGGWLENGDASLNKYGLPLVNGITINEITTNPSRVKLLEEKYHPALESMEGAAFHFVCLQEKIHFIQLRAISNYVGEREKSKWLMQQAVKNLNQELLKILNKLAKPIPPPLLQKQL